MSLEVQFSIEKRELLVGESPICQLELRNTGRAPLEIFQPVGGGGMPGFRVVAIQTGAERVFRGHVQPSGIPSTQIMEPNQLIRVPIPLLHDIGLLMPGEYLISVIYEFNNGNDQAESAPVKVKVHQLAVRNLFLDSVQGSTVYGVWTNPAADPADIVVSRFDLMPNGGVGVITPVGKGILQARPYISVPPNLGASFGNWIAWIKDNTIQFVHFDENLGVSPVGQLELPSSDGDIVPPLFVQANAQWGVRAAGDVLVWMGGHGPEGSALQRFHLVPMEEKVVAKPGIKINLRGGSPKWAMHHTRSNGTRLITYLEASKRQVTLFSLPVPKQDEAGAGIKVQKLGEWMGDLLAAGATIGLDDVIRGAMLMWTGPEDKQKLEVVGWSIDPNGRVREHHRSTIPWASTVRVGAAKVRVRESGDPAVLLRPLEVEWFVYDGYGKLVPVPAPYKETTLEIDIAFMGGSEVVAICAEAVGGISIKRLDGTDLPRKFI